MTAVVHLGGYASGAVQTTRVPLPGALLISSVPWSSSARCSRLARPLRRSGLANLEQRAEELHGTLEIKSAPGKGTSLVWTAPLA